MTFASHLFAFGFGFVCAIGSVLAVFYFVLLKAIAKNEKNFANKGPTNSYQDVQANASTGSTKEDRNSASLQSSSQNSNSNTNSKPDLEKSQDIPQIIEKSNSLDLMNDPSSTPEFQRSDSQEKKGLLQEVEKKPMDPIHMAVKSKKPSTASPMASRMSHNQNDEVSISGWLKIRGYMNVWWNRWCIVKEGKLIEYRNEKREDCFAIVLLAGCEISMRESSKKGFSFRVSHPTLASIYSSKGLKGENLTSAKFPGNTSECIIRAQDEQEGKQWISAIEKAIQAANQSLQHALSEEGADPEERIAPVGSALGTPTYGISPPMDDQDGKEDSPTASPSQFLSPSSPEHSTSAPISIPKPDDTPLSIRSSMDEPHTAVVDTESSRDEYPTLSLHSDSDKNFNLKSSIDIDKPALPQQDLHSSVQMDSRDIMSGEESEDLSPSEKSSDVSHLPPSNEHRAVTVTVNTQISQDVPESATQNAISPPGTATMTPSTTIPSTTVSSTAVTALPQKEGWMELKQGKIWKIYWFVLHNGMLTYFETEKSTDCSGLIDLDGCKAVQNDVNRIDISHPTNKAIHFVVNSLENTDKAANSPSPALNLDASIDSTNRTLVQLRTERYEINKKWLKSIEQEIILIEGKSKAPLIFPKLPPYFESRTEKCHWFNLFIKRYFKDIRNSQVVMFLVKGILTRKFDRIKKPDYIGNISIDDIQMGNEAITIKEVVIGNTDVADELVGEAEIQYDGGAGLTISTEFFINFPRWHFATVPVVASVKLTSMSGRVIFYAPSETNSSFSLSFTELPKCEFAVNLTVGDKHKYDVSRLYKVSDFVVSVLKKILWKNTVMPNRIFFSLPLPGRKLTVNTKTVTSRRQQEQS
mmetsp:Transcript_29004/g.40822  ORF Transcript_29004/g.40822 Transcript_29004/m.40822 type:complete len:867 (+) Transcript_29004:723-3323(+)